MAKEQETRIFTVDDMTRVYFPKRYERERRARLTPYERLAEDVRNIMRKAAAEFA